MIQFRIETENETVDEFGQIVPKGAPVVFEIGEVEIDIPIDDSNFIVDYFPIDDEIQADSDTVKQFAIKVSGANFGKFGLGTLPIKINDTKAWGILSKRATNVEIQQMIDAGDITQLQVDRAVNPINVYYYAEYDLVPSGYEGSKTIWANVKPSSIRPMQQKDYLKWLDTQDIKGLTKIGSNPITQTQRDLMLYVEQIHIRNMQNFGFDTDNYKMIWLNKTRSSAYADARIFYGTTVNDYASAGRIRMFAPTLLNETALAKYVSDPEFAEKLRFRLFKTTVHESLHWVDWCLNDHKDAYMNLEIATYERYGYKVISYGRYTKAENGRYVAEIMNIESGKVFNPMGWTPDLFLEKKAYDEAVAKWIKDFPDRDPKACPFKLSSVSYGERVVDGTKTITTFTESKVGGATATKAFTPVNVNNPTNPWSKETAPAKKAVQSATVNNPAVKKTIQTTAVKKATTLAKASANAIKQRGTLAYVMGENMGMSDEQLLKYIRENLEKYTANPNNLGGGSQVNGSINGGRDKAFKNYKYRLTGYQYSAILDSRTTETCRYLDGKTVLVDDAGVPELSPPNHWNCRSILVPITATDEQPDTWTGFNWANAPAEAVKQKNL